MYYRSYILNNLNKHVECCWNVHLLFQKYFFYKWLQFFTQIRRCVFFVNFDQLLTLFSQNILFQLTIWPLRRIVSRCRFIIFWNLQFYWSSLVDVLVVPFGFLKILTSKHPGFLSLGHAARGLTNPIITHKFLAFHSFWSYVVIFSLNECIHSCCKLMCFCAGLVCVPLTSVYMHTPLYTVHVPIPIDCS